MKTIILRPKNKRESKIFVAIAKALNTPFEIKDKGSYDPAFVEKILKGERSQKSDKPGLIASLEGGLWK